MKRLGWWAQGGAGLGIALGAFGHSLGGLGPVQEALARAAVPIGTVRLIVAVWHFAGLCMLLLGALALRSCHLQWKRAGREAASWMPASIGAAYAAYGAWAVLATGQSFFAVFSVLGGLLFAGVWLASWD
jgi:hypothetical protein